MNFLFGRKKHDLFADVKSEGERVLQLPTEGILSKEDKVNYEEKRQQFVLVVTSLLVDEMDLLTFRLFKINEEASVVCRLDDALVSRMSDGFSCDIAVKAITQFGFPLLKFIIFWDFPDGTTQEMEQFLNIEWMDVQDFFNTCIHTKKTYIHGILSEKGGGASSKFVGDMTSSKERNDAIMEEVKKAIDAYAYYIDASNKGVENSFEASLALVQLNRYRI